MFKSLKRITYRVDDLNKAKQWYCAILNTQPAFDSSFAVIFRVNDCSLSLTQGAPVMGEGQERTETFWEVDDIERSYKILLDSGARPHSPIKNILNIRIAQVTDPFGNILGLTSQDINVPGRTVENHPSESAMTVTFCRALASREEREEIKGPDYLAELFLTEEVKKPLKDNASRNWAVKSLSSLYGGIIARTAYIDDLFTSALSENIPQIVFLGAGYDTRSYRFKELIRASRIYEIDIGSTQKRKLSILKESNIEIPGALTFATANFKTDALIDVLRDAGYEENEKTLFIWEGVTYYLTKEAVESALLFVDLHSPHGSAICFDYMTEKQESVYTAEPFRFWISAEAVKPFLADYGITVIENITPVEMEQRYLTLKDGTVAEKALSKFRTIYGIKMGDGNEGPVNS
jgi:methyltransferase (TIGR00027 family)